MIEMGISKAFTLLKHQRNIDYQNFNHHGKYWFVYYIFMYVHQTTDSNSIQPMECPYDKLPCICLHNGDYLHTLYNIPITDSKFKIFKKQHLIEHILIIKTYYQSKIA